MPYVSGYFRRAPGGGSDASAGRRVDVAIYAADGETVLHDRGSARYALTELAFDSGLPGGFLTASFVLQTQLSPRWQGRAGLRVVMRRGAQVVWWGYLEDIETKQRSRITEMSITAIGTYQVLQQRRYTSVVSGAKDGDAELKAQLTANCSAEVSSDYGNIAATGVDISPLTWTQEPVTRLVKVVCEAGNSSGQQMLFALWEPDRWATSSLPLAWLWARDLTTADYLLYTAGLDEGLRSNQTTRELWNLVYAHYGSSYTSAAQDSASQTLYRLREQMLEVGDVDLDAANAARTAYLARHKDPADEPEDFKLTRPGAVRTLHGAAVDPVLLRAGDRLQIADGTLAGTIVMLKNVGYQDGVVTCTPESVADVVEKLAQIE